MLTSAYLNCIGGASGDMLLGALIDVGVPIEELNKAVSALGIAGLVVSAAPDRRGGVDGTLVTVETGGPAGPLSWDEMFSAVTTAALPPPVAEKSLAVLRRMAEAESAVHRDAETAGRPHELGDRDTLADVVGGVAGLEWLDLKNVYSSPLPTGSGVVDAAHGPLPVPAPATAVLLAGVPVVPPPNDALDAGEMVTPTGAALVTSLATFRQPGLRLDKVGYGLGRRDPPAYPNVLALWIGDETGTAITTDLLLVETNVDDMTAEMLAYAQERLFVLGARDVWFTPIQMKKGRPGTMLSALVRPELESAAVSSMLRETSSLGVRVRLVKRHEADRRIVEAETTFGPVPVKLKLLEGRVVAATPEYDACRAIAIEREIPLQDVYRRVQAEAENPMLGPLDVH